MTVGIICEYNPLHLGHFSQIRRIREQFGEDTAIVCAMSGNFVQRGTPAIFSKDRRAQAAVLCGADLVVELPVTGVLSSAEGFARQGVEVLSPLCDVLCFGAETADAPALMDTAQALLSEDFPPLLRQELESGASFPAARAAALERLGKNSSLLTKPNDILAVEYCKAILQLGSPLEIFPIHRPGSYHDHTPHPTAPSATALRRLLLEGGCWQPYVPSQALPALEGATLHALPWGERAMLARLRTMTEAEFEALPYGSEGLWRKLMHASRREPTLEAVLTATKSKRYTRTRLDRMVMCAFLGISAQALAQPVPYTRVLAFSERGRQLLRGVKKGGTYLNAGAWFDHPYWDLESRCTDLYALFAANAPEPPGMETRYRVFYPQKSSQGE